MNLATFNKLYVYSPPVEPKRYRYTYAPHGCGMHPSVHTRLNTIPYEVGESVYCWCSRSGLRILAVEEVSATTT